MFVFAFLPLLHRHPIRCTIFSVTYGIYGKQKKTLTVDLLWLDVDSKLVRVVRIFVALYSCQPLSCAPIRNLPIGPFSSVLLLICVRPSIDERQHIGCTRICQCCTMPIRHLHFHPVIAYHRKQRREEKIGISNNGNKQD